MEVSFQIEVFIINYGMRPKGSKEILGPFRAVVLASSENLLS